MASNRFQENFWASNGTEEGKIIGVSLLFETEKDKETFHKMNVHLAFQIQHK